MEKIDRIRLECEAYRTALRVLRDSAIHYLSDSQRDHWTRYINLVLNPDGESESDNGRSTRTAELD